MTHYVIPRDGGPPIPITPVPGPLTPIIRAIEEQHFTIKLVECISVPSPILPNEFKNRCYKIIFEEE